MSDMSARRLRHEAMALQKNPVENIQALPLETNILEWHYVITGTKGTPFEGGYYHGLLRFPAEYPLKPPSILMYTPNGRFATNRRLCLSNSDFHPESWNPVWGVSTILMGLYSFMLDTAPTLGSVTTSAAAKRKFAEESLAFNVRDKNFCALFPELADLHVALELQKQLEPRAAKKAAANGSGGGGGGAAAGGGGAGATAATAAAPRAEEPGGLTVFVCLIVIMGVLAVILRLG
ncbi:ubiquitin-conjugating enzyme/RWD-like protein [Tribonema minus]|uniref:E2 ubiquitin-conjugating enzyme n=1 Tax=Tribonema minus TaxID=303371 RepID=A0A835Z275_9STRA|nr:ubiquitin-conjugating enzyme/RWD-like protein [Tribonema minus]